MAIISDPRNDENVMISGLQTAFIKFHNRLVDELRDNDRTMVSDSTRTFNEARRITTWHYHWLILKEFLPQFVGQARVDAAVRQRRFYRPAVGQAFMPVEFQGASYRFGHTGVEMVIGGRGGDTLTQNPASPLAITLDGGPGSDTLTGGQGPDSLVSGPGENETLLGREGNDHISARDGEFDLVGCGSGDNDTALLDAGLDAFSGCENRPVGTLSVASKAVRAKAGKVARIALRWRHPEGWRKLAKVELRLLDGDRPIGDVALRPAGKRIEADGLVALVRKASRMRPAGKAVAARLALKLDESLAGRTLRLEVEATGRNGARQLERAGTLRVAR